VAGFSSAEESKGLKTQITADRLLPVSRRHNPEAPSHASLEYQPCVYKDDHKADALHVSAGDADRWRTDLL
jgi:hypothetical protein